MELGEDYFAIGNDIIGAAFDVRNNVGRGMREKFYESALAYELRKRGHDVKCQVTVPAVYCGEVIDDSYLCDMVVDDKVIIEVKAVLMMKESESRQLFTYLKLSGFKLGYLINFGAKEFTIGKFHDTFPYKKGIYRLIHTK